MAELLRTNDPALISVVESILMEEGIDYHVADSTISVMEGSIGAFQRRLLVHDEELEAARTALTEADLGHWLPPLRVRRR
ncbi:DUF2007 domain-containing protein [Nocardioides sp. HDW12B]|uniref:putative signal transducing protein n=1 Tax=Nocardioides sp. HDW12B TaxID=2714939 RepID=UPI001408D6DA|nr:DUF2007 domain-containing protein [Nocardioides sp. HDW12B]QIK66772.1 DUF2007 domain-containing protein [Nocardioides sp. HDW12B]